MLEMNIKAAMFKEYLPTTFKCYPLMAYSSDKVFGYETQFAENIDLNLFPYGWNQTGYQIAIGLSFHICDTFTPCPTPLYRR